MNSVRYQGPKDEDENNSDIGEEVKEEHNTIKAEERTKKEEDEELTHRWPPHDMYTSIQHQSNKTTNSNTVYCKTALLEHYVDTIYP